MTDRRVLLFDFCRNCTDTQGRGSHDNCTQAFTGNNGIRYVCGCPHGHEEE